MTINPEDLMDREKMLRGPLVVFWNQDEEILPNRPMPEYAPPKRKLRHRLLRVRPFKIELRLAPPPDEGDLGAWGARVAQTLGTTWGTPQEGDRAAYLVGFTFARDAPGAVASAGLVLKNLKGFQVGAVQVRAQEAAHTPTDRSEDA